MISLERQRKGSVGLPTRLWSQRASRWLGEAVAARIRARAFGPGGTDVDDGGYPPGVDLVETGALRRSVGVGDVTAGAIVIRAGAAYAGAVNRAFRWLGLSPRDRPIVGPDATAAARRESDASRRAV